MSTLHDFLVDIGLATKRDDTLTVNDPAGNPVPIYTAEQADDMYSAWMSIIESVGTAVTDLPERLAFVMQRPTVTYDVPSDNIHMRTVRWPAGSQQTQPLAQAMKDRTAVTLLIPNTAGKLILTDGHQPIGETDGMLIDPAAMGPTGTAAGSIGTIIRLPTRAAIAATPLVVTADVNTYVSIIEEHITPQSASHLP